MKKLEKTLRQYGRAFFYSLNSNKDKLYEAFVIYYGEEYKNIIKEKLEKIDFCWYVSDTVTNFCKYFFDEIIENRFNDSVEILQKLGFKIENKDLNEGTYVESYIRNKKVLFKINDNISEKYDDIFKIVFNKDKIFNYDYEKNELYNFFSLSKRKQKKFIKKVFNKSQITEDEINKIKCAIEYMDSIKENQYEDLTSFYQFIEYARKKDFKIENRIIDSTNTIVYDKNLSEMIYQYIPGRTAFNIQATEDCNLIFFPALVTFDEDLIHEINHGITTSVLAIKDYEEKKFGYLLKIGSHISDKNSNIALEEILNQKSTLEIEKIFHDLGGKIFNIPDFSCIRNNYNLLFPLINKFYDEYKDLIIKARMTENKNILFSKIDKEVFLEYEKFISEMFINVKERLKNKEFYISTEEIKYADELVDKMKKYKQKEIDMKEYLKELKKHVKSVRILNEEFIDNKDEESIKRKM